MCVVVCMCIYLRVQIILKRHFNYFASYSQVNFLYTFIFVNNTQNSIEILELCLFHAVIYAFVSSQMINIHIRSRRCGVFMVYHLRKILFKCYMSNGISCVCVYVYTWCPRFSAHWSQRYSMSRCVSHTKRLLTLLLLIQWKLNNFSVMYNR